MRPITKISTSASYATMFIVIRILLSSTIKMRKARPFASVTLTDDWALHGIHHVSASNTSTGEPRQQANLVSPSA